MPKIKRWFKVNQDINGDPKSWELSDRFGISGLRAWLEILSIADRNEGVLPGPWKDYPRLLAGRCQSKIQHMLSICRWLTSESADGQPGSCCWVVVVCQCSSSTLALDYQTPSRRLADGQQSTSRHLLADCQGIARVPKWAEYNRTREHDRIPSGEIKSSPPSFPYLPIHNKRVRNPSLEGTNVAHVLRDSIAKNFPNRTGQTEAEVRRWALEADRVNAIDGHPWDQIESLLAWSQQDEFWRSNILSMGKFRKQWNQLIAHRDRQQKRTGTSAVEFVYSKPQREMPD